MTNENSIPRRYVLHFERIGDALFSDSLIDYGWEVKATRDPVEARQLARSDLFSVGIASFEGKTPSHWPVVREVVAEGGRKAIEWIALLDRDLLNQPELARFVYENFHDYHTLPVLTDRLAVTLGRASGLANLKQKYCTVESYEPKFSDMVGNSPQMRAAYRAISKVASLDAPVLITGETGTGKEQAARAIHLNSRRAAGRFVAVNCAALSKELIQSELFGHEKGAFTGAHSRRIGRIEGAQGGTLFLDEIGDLSLELQVTLLRFLEERTIERVGCGEPISVDARVIAATHLNLEEAVGQGRFRDDLYYRLNVLRITLPPLREREDDVELLARYFFEKCAAERGVNVKGISQSAIEVLNAHEWPGNVRELLNRIRNASALGEHRLISPEDLGLERRLRQNRGLSLDQARESAERDAVKGALRRTSYNISKAADELRVSRTTLYRLIERHKLSATHLD